MSDEPKPAFGATAGRISRQISVEIRGNFFAVTGIFFRRSWDFLRSEQGPLGEPARPLAVQLEPREKPSGGGCSIAPTAATGLGGERALAAQRNGLRESALGEGGLVFLALFVGYHLLAYTQFITSSLGIIWPLGPSSR